MVAKIAAEIPPGLDTEVQEALPANHTLYMLFCIVISSNLISRR
jgi:hypothetical protein